MINNNSIENPMQKKALLTSVPVATNNAHCKQMKELFGQVRLVAAAAATS